VGALGLRGLGEVGGLIGETFQDGAGAIGFLGEEDGEGLFQGRETIIVLSGVTVDPIKKGGEVDELVARVDELEIEDFLFARHGKTSRGKAAWSMEKRQRSSLAGERRMV